jgi:hypothetical protein
MTTWTIVNMERETASTGFVSTVIGLAVMLMGTTQVDLLSLGLQLVNPQSPMRT